MHTSMTLSVRIQILLAAGLDVMAMVVDDLQINAEHAALADGTGLADLVRGLETAPAGPVSVIP